MRERSAIFKGMFCAADNLIFKLNTLNSYMYFYNLN